MQRVSQPHMESSPNSLVDMPGSPSGNRCSQQGGCLRYRSCRMICRVQASVLVAHNVRLDEERETRNLQPMGGGGQPVSTVKHTAIGTKRYRAR